MTDHISEVSFGVFLGKQKQKHYSMYSAGLLGGWEAQ
jgi:hypothetical protein